jgi:UDP:flavonoid glycosyltransferase YjiC (YdhE family)
MPEGLQEFLAAGEPPVYLTFGSMMVDDLGYMRQVADIWMEAVRRAGCRAVMQFPHDDLSAFPADERVFKVRRAPYKQVFPRCAMVVHHGGAGTTQSCLLTGRPSIIVAHMADQSFWGSELERLGVAGKTPRRTRLSGKQLAEGIRHVLAAPAMAARAAALGETMARENGVATAVRLIETTFQ